MRDRRRADLIEAISHGYGGCQSEENARIKSAFIADLRQP